MSDCGSQSKQSKCHVRECNSTFETVIDAAVVEVSETMVKMSASDDTQVS